MSSLYVTVTASRRTTMNPNSEEFLNFLRSMGVDMERSQEHSRHESQPPREPRTPRDPDVLQEEPAITILQQARERDDALVEASLKRDWARVTRGLAEQGAPLPSSTRRVTRSGPASAPPGRAAADRRS